MVRGCAWEGGEVEGGTGWTNGGNVHTSTWSRLKDAGGTLIVSRMMAS